MCIDDIAFACALDESLPYFTYESNTMVIVNSKKNCKQMINGFKDIERYIDAIVSHESIHVVISNIEPNIDADAIDDLEVIVSRGRMKFQVTMNNMAFASDSSGLVLPDDMQ